MQIILLAILILFFSGCDDPAPCVPKKIYIKTKVPKLKILYSIPRYKIADYHVLDDNYYKVNITELHNASKASQRRIRAIKFYELQNTKFNTLYHSKEESANPM